MHSVDIKLLIDIAHQAGEKILSIYKKTFFEIQHKEDKSYLTEADLVSHEFITDALTKKYPSIPIISEESKEIYSYETRENWENFFLVDPLDGTREFIQRNDEFTINIALIKKTQPIMGVIHAPAINVTYYAEKNHGAYKVQNNTTTSLGKNKAATQQLRIVTSRSHCCQSTLSYITSLKEKGQDILAIPSGSALKFGLIAENLIDMYPRFSPTMEWDTAAGHILAIESGKTLTLLDGTNPLLYNKKELINPGFIVQ